MKEKSNKQKTFVKIIIILVSCLVALATLTLYKNTEIIYAINTHTEEALANEEVYNSISETRANNEKNYKFLSDLDYITTNNWSFVGWGSIRKDMPPEGNTITLVVDGKNKIFLKGLGIHADAQLTYDISELSQEYTRFVSKAGVDASRGTNGSVAFKVSVSNDGTTWTELYRSSVVTGASEALNIDVNIEGYKYLRIFADKSGNNTADHAVLADSRLVTEDYVPEEYDEYDKIKTLEYYDNILGSKNIDDINEANSILDTDYYRLILEREFVNKIGYDAIVNLVNLDADYRETIDWLLSTNENLEQVIEVGELASGINFIYVLSDLYNEYKDELSTENGFLYTKMMIALSAAYTTDRLGSPLTFSHYTPSYDYIERFEIVKSMYEEEASIFFNKKYFGSYHIELLRTVMQDTARNDEARWLNYYMKEVKNYNTSVYAYVNHLGVGTNYNDSYFYDEAYRQQWEDKFHLSEYGVPFADTTESGGRIQRFWMVIQKGGICWNQSRIITSLFKNVGRPAIGCYQPSHEAAFYYIQDENGNGTWGMANNIFGWGKTGTTWYGGNRYRTIFNWANKSFTRQPINATSAGNSGGYLYLAQANLNRYDDYKKSLYLNLLANSYSDNNDKVEIYNKAIEFCEINLDSYDYKIQSYKALATTSEVTSDDWYQLAKDIIRDYTRYPMAMNDMLKIIRPYLNDVHLIDIDQKEYTALQWGKSLNANNANGFVEWHNCFEIARDILVTVNRELATFSFDGDNAGTIILSSDYDERDISWHYSIDGGKTLSKGITEHSFALSKEEINSITTENDIKIYLDGISITEPVYTIDIKESAGLPSTLFANDLENKLIAATPAMQWKFNEEDEWTSYRDREPDLTGDKTVIVRMGATGVYMAQTTSSTYSFTQDNLPETRQYISISHLTVDSFSTEATAQGRYVTNAIDGNLNTNWHSNWNGADTEKYIVIKLDEIKNITALEFYPLGGGNGKILSAQILVSIDGENWTEVVSGTNWTYANTADVAMKSVDFDPIRAMYVKIVGKQTQNSFIAARMFNLYEDPTVKIVANFSFDGENAGKIVLDDEVKGTNWKYSLDAGTNWKDGSGDVHELTENEIEQINENDDIQIRLDGIEKVYTININKMAEPEINPYVNDWENRLIGITNTSNLEWKLEGDIKWTSYSEKEPVVEGANTLLVRTKASYTFCASDALEYQFNEDENTDKETYIPIEHLTVSAFSSENVRASYNQYEYARNAIDGNINTIWHTSRVATNDERFIVIKLDEPKYISKLQIMKQAGYTYGIIKNGVISTSMDGEHWEEAVIITDLYNPANASELIAAEAIKSISFGESKKALYVKLQSTKSCDYVNGNTNGVPRDFFLSTPMINLYEDTTIDDNEEENSLTSKIEYSTTEQTNQDVTATITFNKQNVTIINNDGSNVYTFTENGVFTFEFTDDNGNSGTATAVVNWIDKNPPIPVITYNINEATNQDVTATITFNKQNVTIRNNDGKNTYTFTENGSFEFDFIGPAGNESTAIASVNWIDKVAPTAEIIYSGEAGKPTNQDVIATLTNASEEIEITNNDGKNTYTFEDNGSFTFEFVDKAGNKGTATAIVNWVDKVMPKATITYDINKITNQDVTATISFDKENVVVTNNNGEFTHTFTQNRRI